MHLLYKKVFFSNFGIEWSHQLVIHGLDGSIGSLLDSLKARIPASSEGNELLIPVEEVNLWRPFGHIYSAFPFSALLVFSKPLYLNYDFFLNKRTTAIGLPFHNLLRLFKQFLKLIVFFYENHGLLKNCITYFIWNYRYKI